MKEADDRQQSIESALEKHAVSLLSEAERRLNDLDLARVAVHATFIELCKRGPTASEDLEGWLSTVCQKHCRKLRLNDKPKASGDEIRWKKVASAGLKTSEGGDTKDLLPSHYASIRRAAAESVDTTDPLKFFPTKEPRKVILPLFSGLVLLLALGFLAYGIFSGRDEDGATRSGEPESATTVRPPQVGAAKGLLGKPLPLPLTGIEGNLPELREMILGGELPAPDDIRIEELLNSFPIALKGNAALRKGCSLSSEIISSPWKPSASLVLVNIRGARNEAANLAVEFRPKSGSVLSQHLLGYHQSEINEPAGGTEIPAGSDILVVLEIEANSYELGELSWKVDGNEAPELVVHRNPAAEPSDDARFAALLCSFGLWLKEEKSDMVDESLLLALARECAADDMDPGRFEFLLLIDQAVKLRKEQADR